jgi:high potential iron-sulfur protein
MHGENAMNSRRQFVLKLAPLAGAAALLPRLAGAQDLPALTEADPMAVALGFRLETAKADQVKFPKHTNEQSCASCVHFMKPGADSARCDLFNKTVPKGGWCSGYSKRP